MSTPDFSCSRLDQMIDLRHPLAVLATRLPWASIEAAVAPKLAHQTTQVRHPPGDLVQPPAGESRRINDLQVSKMGRQAIEPLIGHTKADHRMDRCWLQGAVGDALHALSCAAGYNIRWRLRAIARLGLAALFCVLSAVVAYGLGMLMALLISSMTTGSNRKPSRVAAQGKLRLLQNLVNRTWLFSTRSTSLS